jgi:hypothetical protein
LTRSGWLVQLHFSSVQLRLWRENQEVDVKWLIVSQLLAVSWWLAVDKSSAWATVTRWPEHGKTTLTLCNYEIQEHIFIKVLQIPIRAENHNFVNATPQYVILVLCSDERKSLYLFNFLHNATYISIARQRLGRHIPAKRMDATGRSLLGNGPVNMSP